MESLIKGQARVVLIGLDTLAYFLTDYLMTRLEVAYK